MRMRLYYCTVTAIYLSSGVVENNIVYIILSSMYIYIYNMYCTYGTVYTGCHRDTTFSDSYCIRGRLLFYFIVGRGGDLLSIIYIYRTMCSLCA